MSTKELHIESKSVYREKIPFVLGLPLVGHSFSALKDPLSFLLSVEKNPAPIVRLRIGVKNYYLVQSPDAAKHILQENARNYYKPGAAKMMKKFLGNGLATSNGNTWLQQRRLIQPAFHRKKIEGLFKNICEETSLLRQTWKNAAPGKPVNINTAFLELTLSNIIKTMFGTDLHRDLKNIGKVINSLLDSASGSITSLIKLPLYIPTPANRKFIAANHAFEKIIYSIINERNHEDANQGGDLLDMLLHAHMASGEMQMSARQLRDEITTIFMAGHETTAQTLSWVFYNIALYPEVKKRLKEEVAQWHQHGCSFEKLQQMEFTRAVIEETMRLYPPVWLMARKSVNEDHINGYYLPPSSTLLVNIYGMNHSERWWNDPGSFNPQRMTCKETINRHPFQFIPFGAGQRPCIGNQFAMMVMQVVVGKLVHEFDFEIPNGFTVIPEPNVTLRAKGGIRLVIKKENNEY